MEVKEIIDNFRFNNGIFEKQSVIEARQNKEEITIKNTKAEILDALNEALEREKNLAQMKYDPEKEEKKQKVEKAIETSK